MYYVYVLQSKLNKSIYIGSTSDLEKRLKYHNSGFVKSTKPFRPYRIIFYENFIDKSDALRDELFFKSEYGREVLKSKLKNSISK